jgi:putative membrane protein
MGSADAVPGVSGGTIALIAGIYGRLIGLVTAVTPDRIRRFLAALLPIGGINLSEALSVIEEVDGWFGVALAAGVGVAVVSITHAVAVLSKQSPALLFGFFFGLIAASAVVLGRELTIETWRQAALAILGFIIAFLLSGPVAFLEGGGLIVVFIAGTVAVSAMILPGISGSLLLVILGQYTRMSTALSDFLSALAGVLTGGESSGLFELGSVVVTFIAGGLVGLFTISRVVRAALDRNRRATMAFLIALVVGALRAPIQEIHDSVGFSTDVALTFLGAAVVGVGVLLVLDWYAVDLDLDSV